MNLIHVTKVMTGKMLDMWSINAGNTKRCKKRAKNKKSICFKCYNWRFLARYLNAKTCFERNTKALSKRILSPEELPTLDIDCIRLDAYGELKNSIHFMNLIKICEKNPDTFHVLWTKEVDYVKEILDNYPKPKNLRLIYSSPIINVRAKLPEYFDKVFTVYDEEGAKKVKINCGGKLCRACMICYDPKNRTIYVNEYLK